MPAINYDEADALLAQVFTRAETIYFSGGEVPLAAELQSKLDLVFDSNTQAYREVLLGCCLAKLIDNTIDIHLPYMSHGENAFNARELDQRVVNPFFQSKQIPSTKGPYLSAFRRQVKFVESTREGLRDKAGYDSLLSLIDYLDGTTDSQLLEDFLAGLLVRFINLREDAHVPITRVQRISLPQYKELLTSLVTTQSGGWLPVLLVVSMFKTLKDQFGLDWEIDWQSINAADAASGVGGDVTIRSEGRILLSIEVTLRQVDRARLVSTFNTKIATTGIEDYLFLVGANSPTQEAIEQAERYFAQGHEVNFAEIVDWLVMLLGTLGKEGRDRFAQHVIDMLEQPESSQAVKVSWNETINRLFTA